MSTSGLSRWAGPAAVLGGALSILYSFVGENHWSHLPLDAARHALLLVGIVGLYLYLRREARFGWLGEIGFYLCSTAFALIAALDVGILINESVEQLYVSLGLVRTALLVFGLLLFGVAAWRTGSMPYAGPPLLIAAAVANVGAIIAIIASGGAVVGWIFMVPTVLLGLGWVLLGYGLWSGRERPASQPEPVS